MTDTQSLKAIFAIYLLSLIGLSLNFNEVDCLCSITERHEIERYFSTKTPYRVIANLAENPYEYEGCQPTRMWSIVRHGSRNPSKKIIKKARVDLEELKTKIINNANIQLCEEEISRLRAWQFNVTLNEDKFLVAEGENELIELAERMQKRFPNILYNQYSPEYFYFKYTKTQRTLKSAESFASGLFGRDRIREIIYPEALHKDPILRFYKLCSRWKNDVDENSKTFENVRMFLQGPEMQEVISRIKQRTKLDEISAEDAQLIYTICAFETAWQPKRPPSVWCSLFDRDSIQVLEFAEDLEYYWNDGYGYELTHKIACPAIADMFTFIDPDSKSPNATFYFTHSGTILKVLAHLGLYNDSSPLTFKDFAKERLWRTSVIDSFASNIGFVLYECTNREPMVLTLHQERPVRIPGCPNDNDLCSLHKLRKIFQRSLESCDFDELCQL